jgi:hypothetical protein
VTVAEYGRHFLRAVTEPRLPAHHHKRENLGPAQTALATMADEVPSSLFGVVESAVDAYEIAASLETCGLSNAVVRDRLGWKDVFSLAEQLYTEVQLRAAPASDLRPMRTGNASDLGRGLVFAAPTLMFAGATIALGSWLAWWMLPLSLACGWAFSQGVAYVGFSRISQPEKTASPVLWAVLAAPLFCVLLGLAGDAFLGGKFYGVLIAAAGCVFMAAAAELIVHGEELLIALTLLPGATGSIIFITQVPFAIPASVTLALTAASLLATVAVALRHLSGRWWLIRPVDRGDTAMAFRYFGLGIFSGLLVSIFIVLEPAKSGTRGWPAVAVYPMVLSLGVMEWQLHTLRAGARNALVASHSLGDFARASRGKLARATLSYLAVLAVLTGLVLGLAYSEGVHVDWSLLVAGTALAVAFFLALVVGACGRIDIVLRAWVPGLVIYGAWGIAGRIAQPRWPLYDARLAFCVAALVSLVAMAGAALRVVVNPICHG